MGYYYKSAQENMEHERTGSDTAAADHICSPAFIYNHIRIQDDAGAMPDDAFKAVTVDLPLNVGQAVLAQSPGAAFVLLSGQGADRTETSRVAFARFKGMAENALDQMDFARFHSFRPGYIYPVTPRQEPNFTYRLARLLYPALRAIYPNVGLPAPDLAWAMVEGAIAGTPGGAVVLENADIRAFAAARSAST